MNQTHPRPSRLRTGWLVAALMLMGKTLSGAETPAVREDLLGAIQVNEQRVAAQQDRVAAIGEKLKATDAQIERRVERVTAYLVSVSDGAASKTKVTRAKQDLFESLEKNIAVYAAERGRRFGELIRPHSPEAQAQLAGDIRWLNERIDKRVDQALSLVASLPIEKDVPRTLVRHEDGDRDRYANPVYRQQQRVSWRGERWRDDACDALKESVERLRRNGVDLERAVARAATPELQALAREFLERSRQTVERRLEQVEKARLQANPAAKELGAAAADALTEQVEDERSDAKKDQAEWTRLKSLRDVETARLRALQDWLANLRRQAGVASP